MHPGYRHGKCRVMEHPLRLFRKATDRTLADLADMLGTSAATVSRWETGERQPAPERVPEISRVTGIPPHKLRPDVFESAA